MTAWKVLISSSVPGGAEKIARLWFPIERGVGEGGGGVSTGTGTMLIDSTTQSKDQLPQSGTDLLYLHPQFMEKRH